MAERSSSIPALARRNFLQLSMIVTGASGVSERRATA
jgi:hypothetical protein